MPELQVGDIVKLKSHPQEMVVNVKTSDGIVCVWIDDYGTPHRESYVSAVLEIVTNPDPLQQISTRRHEDEETGGDHIPF